MGFGIALGGVASGLESGLEITRKNREMDLRQQALSTNKALREKALGIQAGQVQRKQDQALLAEGDKILAQHTKVITELVAKAREAGQPPEKIMATVQPLLEDAEALSTKLGKDPAFLRNQVTAMVGIPSAEKTPQIGSTMEGIKAKLASGQELSPGEKQLYDDAQKTSDWAKILGGAEPTVAAKPSTSPLAFEQDVSKRITDQVYNLPNGRQGIWRKDPNTGATGWELVN